MPCRLLRQGGELLCVLGVEGVGESAICVDGWSWETGGAGWPEWEARGCRWWGVICFLSQGQQVAASRLILEPKYFF